MGRGRCKGIVLSLSFEQVALTGSTNADLLARAGTIPEGLWLRADRQDSGRGRMGREWDSPTGNLYASTVVQLQPSDPPAATLAFVAAVAAYDMVRDIAPDAAIQIKWPNDLLSGAGAKFSGMLLERSGETVVIGIGINLAHYPEGLDRPVTSVAALGGTVPPPQQATEALARHFEGWLLRWRGEGIGAIVDAWTVRAHKPGTPITANLPDGEKLDGHFAGLASDGALQLCLADGSIRAIHAGDVFLV